MIDDTTLSAWLEGDLPAHEAAAVAEAVAADPALAQRADALIHVVELLDGLDEPAPSAALVEAARSAMDRDVAEPDRSTSRRSSVLAAFLGAAAAAAIGTVIGSTSTAPALVHVRVENNVITASGALRLEVEDLITDVDGTVRVEPLEDPMDRTHLIAGGVAAALTFVVLDGHATVVDDKEGIGTLEAGDRHVIRPPARTPIAVAPARLAEPRVDDTEVETLRQEVATLRQANAMLDYQVKLVQGTPIPWPETYRTELSPEAFEQTVSALLPEDGSVLLADVDCTEFPCLAFLESERELGASFDDLIEGVQAVARDPELFGDATNVWTWPSVTKDADGSVLRLGVMVLPEGRPDEDFARRVSWRAEARLTDLTWDAATER